MTASSIARLVVLAVLCAVPLVQHNSYWLHVLSLALIGAVLAMAWLIADEKSREQVRPAVAGSAASTNKIVGAPAEQ